MPSIMFYLLNACICGLIVFPKFVTHRELSEQLYGTRISRVAIILSATGSISPVDICNRRGEVTLLISRGKYYYDRTSRFAPFAISTSSEFRSFVPSFLFFFPSFDREYTVISSCFCLLCVCQE